MKTITFSKDKTKSNCSGSQELWTKVFCQRYCFDKDIVKNIVKFPSHRVPF